jgi:hypothetical protein
VFGGARPSHLGLVLIDHESCFRPDVVSVLKRFLSDSEALSLVLPSNMPPETSGTLPGIVGAFQLYPGTTPPHPWVNVSRDLGQRIQLINKVSKNHMIVAALF